MEKTKNVFISHYGKDNDKIEDLRNLLSKQGYSLRDSSISSQDNNATSENYIKEQLLKPKINWAGQMIVLIGKQTHKRDFVNWEIEQAHKEGKPILGIYVHGGKTEDYKLPENFERYGSALTGWDTNNIVKALEGDFHDFTNPENISRPSSTFFKRGDC